MQQQRVVLAAGKRPPIYTNYMILMMHRDRPRFPRRCPRPHATDYYGYGICDLRRWIGHAHRASLPIAQTPLLHRSCSSSCLFLCLVSLFVSAVTLYISTKFLRVRMSQGPEADCVCVCVCLFFSLQFSFKNKNVYIVPCIDENSGHSTGC